MKKHKIALFALLVLLLNACGSSLQTDKGLEKLMQKAVKNCQIDTRYASIKGCDEGKELRTVARDTPINIALNTVSIALCSDNIKMRAVACHLLYMELKNKRYQMEQMKKQLSSGMVDNLLKGMKKYPTYVMMYAADAATYAATLTGKTDALIKLLEEYPVKQVKQSILSKLMTYGRTAVLPTLKKFAKDKETYVARAALQAPLWMYKYSAEEKKQVAGWMTEVFKLGDNYEKSIAGKVLYNKIGGEDASPVLDYLDKQITAAEKDKKASWELKRLAYGLYNRKLPKEVQDRAAKLKERLRKIK